MDDENEQGEMLEIENDDVTVEDTDDGGAMITIANEEQNIAHGEHFANIVEEIDSSTLATLASDLVEKVRLDKESRERRDKLYEEGLQRTGLSKDAPGGASFSGASKVVHPLLVEACVDFSARVMKELMPPSGPVRSKINGKQTIEKLEKAQRKTEFMNWQLTEQIQEFRGELEQLSTQLPLGGVQYLKWLWDSSRRRAVPEFIPVDDMILPFAATNFYSAERRTHIQYLTAAKYRERVKRGMYIDVDLPTPEDPEFSKAERANQRIEGKEPTSYNEDGLRTVFEITTSLDVESEGEYRPYIVTIDKSTERVLSLYRNWQPEDPHFTELEWAVEFPFIPWRGSAPIGLTHMIGSLAGGATGALRALLDSAHINNVPAMLKLKGGPNGQTVNVQPTQVTEIEGSAGVDDIRKMAMPLPFNPPSPVLFQLLGFLVDAGKGVVQTSFEKLADGNQNAPVGTTLALIEQGMVVFSSIHSRMHTAMSRCFKILQRLNASYLTDDDIAAYGCGIEISPEDFDGPNDVVPVGDPQIFSETQRFAQTTAIQQRAAVVPQLYNARKVEMMFLRSMKVDPSDVLIEEPGEENRDPVSENVAATMGQPVYVISDQDHVQHIEVHLAYLQSPMFGQNPAIIKTFLYPMAQHLRDHLIHFYMKQAHRAIHVTQQEGDEMNAEREAELIIRVQQAIEAKYGEFAQMLAQIDQAAEQYKPQPQMPPDNSMQIAQIKQQTDMQKLQATTQLKQAEMAQDAQTDAQKMQMQQALMQMEAQLKQMAEQNRMMIAQLTTQGAAQRSQHEIDARVRMNDADNKTAMAIAAAEMATGEKVALSTGTGINP